MLNFVCQFSFPAPADPVAMHKRDLTGSYYFITFKFHPMGKIKEGILGGFSGKVGPVVGSSWKGIAVMRSLPPHKRGKSTELQLRQMAKVKLVTDFVSPLANFLTRAYSCVTVKMSCYNKAFSYNVRNAVSGEYPVFRINYPRVTLGMGDLLNPDTVSVDADAAGQIRFSWPDNSGEGSARATDRAFVAVYCESQASWSASNNGSQRNTGSYTLDVAAFSGKLVHAYIGFLSDGAQFVSTSKYAGELIIL